MKILKLKTIIDMINFYRSLIFKNCLSVKNNFIIILNVYNAYLRYFKYCLLSTYKTQFSI